MGGARKLDEELGAKSLLLAQEFGFIVFGLVCT